MTETDRSKCRALLGSLSDYADGSLGDEACEQLERHLAECQDCRVVVDTLRKTIYLYRATAEESGTVPAPVRERLFRTLKLEDYLRH